MNTPTGKNLVDVSKHTINATKPETNAPKIEVDDMVKKNAAISPKSEQAPQGIKQ